MDEKAETKPIDVNAESLGMDLMRRAAARHEEVQSAQIEVSRAYIRQSKAAEEDSAMERERHDVYMADVKSAMKHRRNMESYKERETEALESIAASLKALAQGRKL